VQALVAVLVVAALTPVWARALDRDARPGTQGAAVPTSAPVTASGSGPPAALPTALSTLYERPRGTGKPVPNGTVTVGKEPGGLAISPDSRTVYVANMRSGEVSFVDVAKRRVGDHVHLPVPPRYVAVSPNGRRLYVSMYRDDYSGSAVAVIDVKAKKIIRAVPTGQRPYALAVAPDGRIWVPIHDASRMEVIDDNSLKVVATVIVPKNPHGVAFSPDGKFAYTPDHESGKVSIIDTLAAKPIAAIDVGKDPHALAVSPDGSTIFVANYTLDLVKRIDVGTRRINATIEVQDEPQSIAFSRNGSHAYVVNEESNSVSTVETAGGRVTDTQRVGQSPRNVAVAPDGRFAYVTLGGADKLWVGKIAG
jgi:YVTN family beta-propeller protein